MDSFQPLKWVARIKKRTVDKRVTTLYVKPERKKTKRTVDKKVTKLYVKPERNQNNMEECFKYKTN